MGRGCNWGIETETAMFWRVVGVGITWESSMAETSKAVPPQA